MSKSEIEVLVHIAGSKRVLHHRDITQMLGLCTETVSRIITRLEGKGLVEREEGRLVLAKSHPAESFKRLYYAHRASPFELILTGRRIDIICQLSHDPKSAKELEKETAISLKTIYFYLQDLGTLGIVKKMRRGRGYLYLFNYTFWGELKDFAAALLEFEKTSLVPREGMLIKSYKDNVLFKSMIQLDATPTSFSDFASYGIELDLRDNYYTLPKRELFVRDVFLHSLDSAGSLSHRLFCILFYLKNEDDLKGIEHPMVDEMRAVLRGEKVRGYPSLEDVRDRAGLYDIER